jgi:hypothetical protein
MRRANRVIWNNWLTSKDEQGNRRLDNFVRMQIAAAPKRKIRVIPLLVGGGFPNWFL